MFFHHFLGKILQPLKNHREHTRFPARFRSKVPPASEEREEATKKAPVSSAKKAPDLEKAWVSFFYSSILWYKKILIYIMGLLILLIYIIYSI